MYGVYWSSSPQKDRFGINHNLPMFTKFCVKSWWLPKTLHLRQSIHRVHVHLWGFSRMASPRLVGMEKWTNWPEETRFSHVFSYFLRPKWNDTPIGPGQTSPQLAIMPLIDLVDHHLPIPEHGDLASKDIPGWNHETSNCGVFVQHVNPCYESPLCI
jgi:hypothetical protein